QLVGAEEDAGKGGGAGKIIEPARALFDVAPAPGDHESQQHGRCAAQLDECGYPSFVVGQDVYPGRQAGQVDRPSPDAPVSPGPSLCPLDPREEKLMEKVEQPSPELQAVVEEHCPPPFSMIFALASYAETMEAHQPSWVNGALRR